MRLGSVRRRRHDVETLLREVLVDRQSPADTQPAHEHEAGRIDQTQVTPPGGKQTGQSLLVDPVAAGPARPEVGPTSAGEKRWWYLGDWQNALLSWRMGRFSRQDQFGKGMVEYVGSGTEKSGLNGHHRSSGER